MKGKEVFKRCQDCQLVKGFKRSAIYDLTRNSFDFIPNPLYDILIKYDGCAIDKIKADYLKDDIPIIEEYFEYLQKKEYIFFCTQEEKRFFIPIDMRWESSSQITNAIISHSGSSNFNLLKIAKELDELGCKHILLFSPEVNHLNYYYDFLNSISKSSIISIDIFVKYKEKYTFDILNLLTSKYERIRNFTCYDSPFTYNDGSVKNSRGIIIFTKENISLNGDFRKNIRYYFNVNIELFMESQRFNTFLNRKVFVSHDGEIKNAPTSEESFANVESMSIKDVVYNKSFKKLWRVHKDLVDVCKNCEFRHMCVDPRIPKKRKDGSYYHEKECFYNPFIAKWQGDDGYFDLKKCGVIVNDFVYKIDLSEISRLNNQIYKN